MKIQVNVMKDSWDFVGPDVLPALRAQTGYECFFHISKLRGITGREADLMITKANSSQRVCTGDNMNQGCRGCIAKVTKVYHHLYSYNKVDP